MDTYYTRYYSRQYGGSLSDIGPIYKSPVFYQKGSGVGSFFTGLFKYLKPAISSGFDALKHQSVRTGKAIINDVGSKPLKEILKEHGKIAVQELAEKGINKLKRMRKQSGGGGGGGVKKRKKHIKRRKLNRVNHSKSKIVKRQRVLKQKINRVKKRQKARIVDIFNN